MATVTQRGNSYVIRYTYQDDHGKSCAGWETRKTEEEAIQRKQQIEYELAAGTFLMPSKMTVRELMEKWLEVQSAKHKWAPKTYEATRSDIMNLIIPYIGNLKVQEMRPYHFEELYATLSKTPCRQYIQGQINTLTPQQNKRLLSGTTIHAVHSTLHTAFSYAVEWRLISSNPVPHDAPQKTTEERPIWTDEEMLTALSTIQDPMLHLAVHMTVVCSLRAGELLGISPEDLDFDAADGRGLITISKSLQRVGKKALAHTDPQLILHQFPDKREGSVSTLILKRPKNKTSIRKLFMTGPLRNELKEWLHKLEQDEAAAPDHYQNCGLLFRLPNGQTVEQTFIRKKFEQWLAECPEYSNIVFHDLRHSSATYQLLISDGDVKSVQGNTGHASAGILVNTYAHIQDAPRRRLSERFEERFYQQQATETQKETPIGTLTGPMLLDIIRHTDPETKRELVKALFA